MTGMSEPRTPFSTIERAVEDLVEGARRGALGLPGRVEALLGVAPVGLGAEHLVGCGAASVHQTIPESVASV